MSLECAECERDLRGGHSPGCSRYVTPILWVHDTDEEGFPDPPRQATPAEVREAARELGMISLVCETCGGSGVTDVGGEPWGFDDAREPSVACLDCVEGIPKNLIEAGALLLHFDDEGRRGGDHYRRLMADVLKALKKETS